MRLNPSKMESLESDHLENTAGPRPFDAILAHLRQAQRVMVIPHWQSDGDCLGSALGLAWALRRLGKTVVLSIDDRPPAIFDYLPGFAELTFQRPANEDLIVLVDGSDRTRFGRLYELARATGKPLVQIDHHATNDLFADVNWVDSTAASCAELVYRLVVQLRVPLDPALAQCLLTGVLTDTLVFRTPGTTPSTLQVAIDLVAAGGSIPQIVDRVYNRRPFNNLHLLGHVLSQAQLEGPVIWSQITQRDFKRFGVNGSSSTGMINTLLTVEEAQIALLLTEREDGRIEVGLRSRVGYDVAKVAYALGGGGHKQASGALLPGPIETARARVLAEIARGLPGQVELLPTPRTGGHR